MSTDSDNVLNLLSREEHSAEAESQYDAPVTASTEEFAHTDHTGGTTQRRVTRVTRIGPIRASHHGSGRPIAQRPGRSRPYHTPVAHRPRWNNSRRFRPEQPTCRTVHEYGGDTGSEFYDPTDGRYQLPDWQGFEQQAQHLVPVRPPPPPPHRVVVQPVSASRQLGIQPLHSILWCHGTKRFRRQCRIGGAYMKHMRINFFSKGRSPIPPNFNRQLGTKDATNTRRDYKY